MLTADGDPQCSLLALQTAEARGETSEETPQAGVEMCPDIREGEHCKKFSPSLWRSLITPCSQGKDAWKLSLSVS